MTFAAATDKYAFAQGFDASSLQHRRPSLVSTLWQHLRIVARRHSR